MSTNSPQISTALPILSVQFFILFLSAFLLASCGEKKVEVVSGPTFTNVYGSFDTACVNCHSPGGSAFGGITGMALNFSTKALAYQTLLGSNVSATSNAGNCPSVKIVNASNVASSYLAGILISSYAQPNFGGRAGCTPSFTSHAGNTLTLSPKDLTRIENWISAGALND